MKNIFFVIFGALLFIACGNGNVDKVKNYTLSTFNTMTIGNAIEGSKICKDVKWEDLSKDGLSVVRVICYESDEYIKERNTKIENKYNKDLENYNKNIQSYETRLNNAIENKKKEIEKSLAGEQESRDKDLAEIHSILNKHFTKDISDDEIIKIAMQNCKTKQHVDCDRRNIEKMFMDTGIEQKPKEEVGKYNFHELHYLLRRLSDRAGYAALFQKDINKLNDELTNGVYIEEIKNNFSASDPRHKAEPKKPEIIKSVSREINFVIKPDGKIDRTSDIYEIIDGKKVEGDGRRTFGELYKRDI